VVNPVERLLACGDIGVGAMADVSTVVAEVRAALAAHADKATIPAVPGSGVVTGVDHHSASGAVDAAAATP
jgi:hypothetical protein